MEAEKNQFLLKMYDSVWINVRNRENTIIKYFSFVVSAIGLIGFSLYNNLNYLFLASMISEILLLWGWLLLVEANYEYRRDQKMMSKIEKALMGYSIYNFIPKKYHKVKNEFIEIYQIHSIIFMLFYFFIPVLFIYRNVYLNNCHFSFWGANQHQVGDCWLLAKAAIVLLVAIAGVIVVFFKWIKRKDDLKDFINEVDKLDTN